MKALVTGANGFIGRALCDELVKRGHQVRAAIRHRIEPDIPHHEWRAVGDISEETDWRNALEGVDVVFHVAGLAHLSSWSDEALLRLRRTNVGGTESLARASAAAGVRRVVFLSTAKVNGESSGLRPFTEADAPSPRDLYAEVKFAAEHEIRAVLGSRFTIVRPPLVYGPGVRANFLALMRAVDRHLPLPLGAVKNSRTLVFVGNLVDAMVALAENDRASGEVFLVGDRDDVSTPELIRRIGHALGKRPLLVPVPDAIVRAVAALPLLSSRLEKIVGSLQLDTSKIAALGWSPPFPMQEGLSRTAQWFRGIEK